MNKKGFTLVELLTVIVIIGLIAIIAVPNFMNIVDTSKQKSYDILIENIVTASKLYYEECEYGDLSNKDKYGASNVCIINDDNTIDTTLGMLANTGLLKVSDKDATDKKIVLNPINDENISNCNIKITKVITENTDSKGIVNKVVSYTVTKNDTNSICPNEYK